MINLTINLLPKDLRGRVGPDLWEISAVGIAGVSAAAFLTMQLIAVTTASHLSAQIDDQSAALAKLAPIVNKGKALKAEKAQLELTAGVADTLRGSGAPWSQDLARFAQQLPKGPAPLVALETMTLKNVALPVQEDSRNRRAYDGKTISREVQVTGNARSGRALVEFISAFETPQWSGVQFQNAEQDEATGAYRFALTVGLTSPDAPKADPKPASPAAADAAPPSAPQAGGAE